MNVNQTIWIGVLPSGNIPLVNGECYLMGNEQADVLDDKGSTYSPTENISVREYRLVEVTSAKGTS